MKTTKTAVIADIHGNLCALKTVLDDIEKKGCEEIICLGDIVAKGFHNSACVKLVRKHCAHSLMGNCDAYFSMPLSMFAKEREIHLVKEYQKTMDAEDIAWLAALPFSYECMISGRLVRFFHAGPDSYNNYRTTTFSASIDEKYSMFAPTEHTQSSKFADVVIYGHVHMQMMNRLYNRTLICAGSVGNPLDFVRNDAKDAKASNTTGAQYLIIEGIKGEENGTFSVSFEQVPYDISAELKDCRDFFEYEDLAYELTTGKYRRYEKIRRVLLKDGIDLDKV